MLIMQLMVKYIPKHPETTVFTSEHIPEFSDIKKQCQVCYLKEKNNIEFTHAVQHHNAL